MGPSQSCPRPSSSGRPTAAAWGIAAVRLALCPLTARRRGPGYAASPSGPRGPQKKSGKFGSVPSAMTLLWRQRDLPRETRHDEQDKPDRHYSLSGLSLDLPPRKAWCGSAAACPRSSNHANLSDRAGGSVLGVSPGSSGHLDSERCPASAGSAKRQHQLLTARGRRSTPYGLDRKVSFELFTPELEVDQHTSAARAEATQRRTMDLRAYRNPRPDGADLR